jgi:hypothetical protein
MYFAVFYFFRDNFVHFLVIWYISPILVLCIKKKSGNPECLLSATGGGGKQSC